MTTLHASRFVLALAIVPLTFAVTACPKAPETPATAQGDTRDVQPSSQPGAAGHEEHHAAGAQDREHVDTDGVVRRGSPLTPELETVPVSVAVTKAKDYDGKKIKLAGKVESVCAKMGCWFVVQGEKPEDKIRISTKAHNIFVPKSATGMIATVEGTFSVKTLPKETAQHYEDERELKPGETRKTFTADVQEFSIDVAGLEMFKRG